MSDSENSTEQEVLLDPDDKDSNWDKITKEAMEKLNDPDFQEDTPDSPQTEEILDKDFVNQGDDEFEGEQEQIQDNVNTDANINMGDIYLLIIEKGDKFKDYMGSVLDIFDDFFVLNNDKDQKIKINIIDGQISLDLDDDATIIDIVKVQEIDIKDTLNESQVFKEDSIKIKVEEVEKKYKKYNDTEIIEDFISEIINLYDIYDDELFLRNITDMAHSFFEMIKNKSDISDINKTDSLQFIKNMTDNNFNLPDYILPIVSSNKKLYLSDDEIVSSLNNTIFTSTEQELVDLYHELNADKSINYFKYLSILFSPKFAAYVNNDENKGCLINYKGQYFRDCFDIENPCYSLSNSDGSFNETPYIIDFLKSRDDIYIINDNEKIPYLVEDNFNIIGFLFVPENYSKYFLKLNINNHFTLNENIILYERLYNIKSLRNYLSDKDILLKSINDTTVKDDFDKNIIQKFMLDVNTNQNLSELTDILIKNLPTNNDIINKYFDENIFNFIYNYKDFEILLSYYELFINDILKDTKIEITDKIKQNIKLYEETYKKLLKSVIKEPKKIKFITKQLDINDKIKICLDFIFTTKNVVYKNSLLNRFIKVYCREPNETDSDKNWLYSPQTNEKILCKHYCYLCKIDKHPEYYNNLISLFGSEPDNGNISCKVCGHFIDNVNFSTFDGFSDGSVIQIRETMDNDNLDDNISSNIELKKYINKISKLFNIKLYPNDLENIINIYQLIDINKLLNFRYSDDNIINNDPFISKLKEKYPVVKKTKDKDTKKLNEKNKGKIKKSLVSFKKYLLDVTKLLLTIILIFIHMQISTNTYPINLNNMYNIFIFDDKSSWKMFNISNDDSFLNKRLIEYINVKIESKIKSLYEKLENKSLFDQPDLKSHMINTIKYILNPQYNLYKSIDRYYTLTITSGYLYTKEEWPTFKPLNDNKLVLKINEYVNSHNEIMKQYFMNSDSLENISLIKDINNVQSKYEEFRLPVSNLMNNPSYKRLYMYSLKLYGKCSTIPPILDLLTNKFINDMNNQDITDLLKSCNYNDGYTKVLFNDFKKIIIAAITNYEIDTTKDKDNIVKFKNININNTEYLLLNSNRKGYYKYVPAKIFINLPFDELNKQNGDFIDKLFNNYCIDSHGDLIENTSVENQLNFYKLDFKVDFEDNSPECSKSKIPHTSENYHKIMKYIINRYKLNFNPLNFIDYTESYNNEFINNLLHNDIYVENRLYSFINNDKYLKDVEDSLIFQQLNTIIEKIITDKQNKSFNLEETQKDIKTFLPILNSKKEEYLQNINDLYNNILKNDTYYSKFNKLQITRIKNLVPKIKDLNNIDNISLILNKLLEDINNNNIYNRFIGDLYYNLSRIKNKYKKYKYIRKGLWKMSDTSNDKFNNYLNMNDSLLHFDQFFIRKKEQFENGTHYSGFKQYDSHESSIYFEELFKYIKNYNLNLDLLKGSDKNIFNDDVLINITSFIFIFIINKIAEYISKLFDDSSDVYKINTTLFEKYDPDVINIDNNIVYLSRFLLDIIIDMYEKLYNPNWVFTNNDVLNNSIMKQVSREKQNYINKIDRMSKSDKFLNDLKQEIGTSMLFHESAADNADFVASEDYEKDFLSQLQGGYEQHLYDPVENNEIVDGEIDD